MPSIPEPFLSKLTHPFDDEKQFVTFYSNEIHKLFIKFGFVPTIQKSALIDAYAIWRDELLRWTLSMELSNGARSEDSETEYNWSEHSVPSHLKKAGALACAFNRTKPVSQLLEANSYQDGDYQEINWADSKIRLVTLFPNEFLAFDVARVIVLTEETARTDITPLAKFESANKKPLYADFDIEYVESICRYMRLRSPSPSSLYQIFRSYGAYAYNVRSS